MRDEKACDGDMTYDCDPNGDFKGCHHCEREVRWDMVDHPFWGFAASCPKSRRADAESLTKAKRAVTPAASEAK
jgi:hypothetical protein